mmetsp:Transcript_31662/g.67072  ORF Transcript_31662/g.67072 Transcript_31662/m.67072 type:complete len:239 (+) Transcript_31662:181-897(+)
MDALAGYESDSTNEKNEAGGALTGLLASYSDDDELVSTDTAEAVETSTINTNQLGIKDVRAEQNNITPAKKRPRRWDNPNDRGDGSIDEIKSNRILPPPQLSTTGPSTSNSKESNEDPFQSLQLFPKDYTLKLREKLTRQLQSQTENPTKEYNRLNEKLNQISSSSASSFASHLKSQHEFGNPRLLKNIIDHFQINPLESHVGNDFGKFEYVERLVVAEEKSRIAAANFSANVGPGGV